MSARLPVSLDRGLRRVGLPLASWPCSPSTPSSAGAYFVDVGFFFGIYALLGLSLNIVLGEVGLYDLGHAGFYAIGAYTTAILNTRFGIPVLAAAAGERPGRRAVRLPGHLAGDPPAGRLPVHRHHRHGGDRAPGPDQQSLRPDRRAQRGVRHRRPVPGLLAIDSSRRYYFLVWIVVALAIWRLRRLQRSRIGRAWNCIREDEVAAQATGIDVRSLQAAGLRAGGRCWPAWRETSTPASSWSCPPRASPSGNPA